MSEERLLANPALLDIINRMEYTDDQKDAMRLILDAEIKLNNKVSGEEYIASLRSETEKAIVIINRETEKAIAQINGTVAVKVARAQHRWRSSIVWAVALLGAVMVIMTNLPKQGVPHELPGLQSPQNEEGSKQEASP